MQAWTYIRRHKSISTAVFLGAVLASAIAIQAHLRTADAPLPPQTRTVSVTPVRELAATGATIPTTGTVTSRSEARIRTQTQGEVTRVYRTVGDRVSAGSVIAELGNASERASVVQAQGQLEAAQAQLAEIRAGARTEQRAILTENVASAERALAEARTSARNTLYNSRSTLDTAIRIRADAVFSNPQGDDPQLVFNATDLRLANDVTFRRRKLQTQLAEWNATVDQLSNDSDVRRHLNDAETIVQTVRTFLEDLTALVNDLEPNANLAASTIDGWQSSLSTARSEVNTLSNSLSQARSTLSERTSALETARQNLEEGTSGGRPEAVAAQKAAVTQARGQLASANAQLERTIVRSPITGTINTLAIDQGDFVQAHTLAAVVSNNQSLQIDTAVNTRDRDRISVGNTVTISERTEGTVTSISPGLNPDTGKIDVTVGVTGTDPALTHGDTVRLEITQSETAATITTDDPISLPITAIKMTGDGAYVFTVNAAQELVAHAVTLGTLSGESIRILDGVTPEMEIVTDARGLAAGETVRLTEAE